MTEVSLCGQLLCVSGDEIDLVRRHLTTHLELTRAEGGCLRFDVTPTADPFVWEVDELFRDAAAFRAHQARVADSEWGRVTAAIERRYVIDGL